eukprot:gene8456-941_t
MDYLELDEIESAFTFLGDVTGQDGNSDDQNQHLTFPQFALRYFQDKSKSACKHKRGAISGPLLKQIWGDQDAERVLTVWYTILRFMGDLPPKQNEETMDNLQRVQLICNVGITRPNTRDEIYCQLCKQLTDNPNKVSRARGYILLALLAGCFLPSDAFLGVLKRFMEEGPPQYTPFLLQQLQRTKTHGTRYHPSTAVEMMMAFKRSPIEFMVHFYVGSQSVSCDSQTTHDELLGQCCQHEQLSPELGLAVFITSPSTEIMTSLSTGYNHVMDAVYEYENLMASKAEWRLIAQERPWLVVVRKECFAPWFEGSQNLHLVYTQIMDGMIRGFYLCESSEHLSMILAQRYYVKYGSNFKRNKLIKQLRAQPVAGMHIKSIEDWADLATIAFDSVRNTVAAQTFPFLSRAGKEYYSNTSSADDVKIEILQYARDHWYIEFSRRFLHCEVTVDKESAMTDMAIFVNCKGIFLFHTKDVAQSAAGGERFSAPFSHFVDISPLSKESASVNLQHQQQLYKFLVSFVTPTGVSTIKIVSPGAKALRELLSQFYQGTVYRSRYCIASLDYRAPGDNSSFLSFQQGDLLVLPKMWSEVDKGGWASGICERTRAKGDFPTANVIVIPSLVRPSHHLVDMFAKYTRTLDPSDTHEL